MTTRLGWYGDERSANSLAYDPACAFHAQRLLLQQGPGEVSSLSVLESTDISFRRGCATRSAFNTVDLQWHPRNIGTAEVNTIGWLIVQCVPKACLTPQTRDGALDAVCGTGTGGAAQRD